jgi:hypothetical protein
VSYNYLFLEFWDSNLVEGGFESFHDDWEVLPPLERLLSIGSVGEVDVEVPAFSEGYVGFKRLPDCPIVRPALQKDKYGLAVGFSFEKILECF